MGLFAPYCTIIEEAEEKISSSEFMKCERCEALNKKLQERIYSNVTLCNTIQSYHVCFEGALGAMQHLAKEDLSNPETVKHYVNVALIYLSFRYEERRKVPNVYKEALDEIEAYLKKSRFCEVPD